MMMMMKDSCIHLGLANEAMPMHAGVSSQSHEFQVQDSKQVLQSTTGYDMWYV